MKKKHEENVINEKDVNSAVIESILYKEQIPKEYILAFGRVGIAHALVSLLERRNPEIRMRAAEHLQYFPSQPAVVALSEILLKDKNYLVRIQAADSLGNIKMRTAYPALTGALKDVNPLVRSYSASALGQIKCRGSLSLLQTALIVEHSQVAKLGFYEALYLLGNESALEHIILMLDNHNYRIRCATANILGGLVKRDSRARILTALTTALKKEETIAVKSALKSSLSFNGFRAK